MDKHSVETATPICLVEIDRQTLTVTEPFNPRTTLHKPSHFPSPFDLVKQGEYLFMTRVGRNEIGGRATYDDSGNRIVLHTYAPQKHTYLSNLLTIEDELARRLGLKVKIDGYEKMWKDDPILSRLPDDMLGARPASPFSLYEFLMICTVLQNTTVRRTVQMAGALAHNLGAAYRFPEGNILHGFWGPNDLLEFGESQLRELRLGYRAKNLVRFSEQFLEQPDLEAELLNLQTNPERLRAKVEEIYGVGPASAAYIMFEWFKCVDEFYHVSPWERKILSKLLFDSFDRQARDIVQFCHDHWAPYTMLAVHAVFEAAFWRRAHGQGLEWLNDLVRL